MAKPSTISRLPKEIREKIGSLRQEGCTIDEILSALEDVKISRSALGRHLQKQNKIAERLHVSRSIAETLAEKMGDAPPSRSQALNIELLHSAIMKIFLDQENPEDPIGETKDLMMLSSAVSNLAKASKNDLDLRQAIEKEIRERIQSETQKALKKVENQGGISKETSQEIARAILGVDV